MPSPSLILLLFAAATLLVQDVPDFSGRWIRADPPGRDDLARVLIVRQTVERTNVRGERVTPFFKDIRIEREFATTSRSETHALGIVGGFVSGTAAGAAGPRGYQGVKWDGNTLVFESGNHTGATRETGVWDERQELWSIEPDGRLRVTITTRSSADVSGTTVTLRYQRVPVRKPSVKQMEGSRSVE